MTGEIKSKEPEYFRAYKSLKGKYPEDAVFQVSVNRRAFYYFTGYKTVYKKKYLQFEEKN